MKLRSVGVLALVVVAAATLGAQVTFDRLLNATREPHNWLSYSGTSFNQRYGELTQIAPANVRNLQLQWVWQARSLEKFEATPLVVDGVMYTVEAPNNIVALDAATGRPFWTFNYTPLSRGPLLRTREPGVAIPVIPKGTIDAQLIAVDARSGQLIWNTGRRCQGPHNHAQSLIVKAR